MTEWHDYPIRSVRELLRSIAAGGRLVHSHRWELNEDNQWHEYVIERAGTKRAVSASIAVTALRKGLITVSAPTNSTTTASVSAAASTAPSGGTSSGRSRRASGTRRRSAAATEVK